MANWFDDLADVGASFGPRRFTRAAARPGGQRYSPARRLIPPVPGVPARGLGEQPLGLGSTAFTATSGTLLTVTASPQRPFRGRRLIIDLTRTGATATGLVTLTRFDVGVDNQLPGAGAIGAGAFAATAFGVDLDLDPATPGVNITLQFNISAAPTMTDRVDIAVTLIGQAVR
jgi:hypothetical protein